MDLLGISSVADLIKDGIDKIFPDPAQAAQAKLNLLQLQQNGEFKAMDSQLAMLQTQTDANKAEAASASVFVAGWRPAIGWACGAAFSMNYVVGPIGTWLSAMIGHPVPFPQLDTTTMMPVLMGMLGLGSLHTIDKIQGV